MNIAKGNTSELEISDMAFGGKGIAKVDGFVVFVNQTVPGDRIKARVVKKKKNYAEAEMLELLSGARVLRTDLDGAVKIAEGRSGLVIKTYPDHELEKAGGLQQEIRNVKRLFKTW